MITQEKAHQIKGIIAEVVGFDAEDISDEDRFIADYKINYTERKTLLEKLNAAYDKQLSFDDFCKLDTVQAVIEAFSA